MIDFVTSFALAGAAVLFAAWVCLANRRRIARAAEAVAKLLTWQDFFLSRDTNTPVSAQLELMPSGDFIARSNLVERTYRRVNPDDWDDDGVPNETDPDPLSCDGDFFGARQELPEGANSNAYCWVDLVVPDANALVTFSGDGYSALPDPVFIARAGETNRVVLLIGKAYQVTSRMPITCVGQSSGEIEVDQVSATELSICWPVAIEAVAMRGGSSFTMSVWPDCLGGGFTWTNSCCAVNSLGGWRYGFTCAANCLCSGCGAEGYYGYEAYRLPAIGGSCGCSPQGNDYGAGDGGDQAGADVSFSEAALFYEEAYTNEPGVVVERRDSTNVTFSCSVNGGPYGGVFSLSCSEFDKLLHVSGDTPPSGNVEIAAAETRAWSAVYAPLTHSSSEGDISATATFSEYVSGRVVTNVAQLTVVELKLEPQVTKEGCENRHLVGVKEAINCYALPDVGQWGEVGGGELPPIRGVARYLCPLTADGSCLCYTVGDSRYDFRLIILEPAAMVARNPVARDFGMPQGHAGGAGMNIEVYVMPETVCFSGIAMEEILSTTGIHQDYFSNVCFQGVWYHTTDMGAGMWKNIGMDNSWGTDRAWMGAELPRELPNGEMTLNMSEGAWSDGTLVWDITWGWAERNTPKGYPPAKSMSTPYNQTFTFTEDGTLTVLKFTNTVSRGTNNLIRLNGQTVHGSPLTQEELDEINGNN